MPIGRMPSRAVGGNRRKENKKGTEGNSGRSVSQSVILRSLDLRRSGTVHDQWMTISLKIKIKQMIKQDNRRVNSPISPSAADGSEPSSLSTSTLSLASCGPPPPRRHCMRMRMQQCWRRVAFIRHPDKSDSVWTNGRKRPLALAGRAGDRSDRTVLLSRPCLIAETGPCGGPGAQRADSQREGHTAETLSRRWQKGRTA